MPSASASSRFTMLRHRLFSSRARAPPPRSSPRCRRAAAPPGRNVTSDTRTTLVNVMPWARCRLRGPRWSPRHHAEDARGHAPGGADSAPEARVQERNVAVSLWGNFPQSASRSSRHADVVRLRARERHALVSVTTDITVGRLGRRRPHAHGADFPWRWFRRHGLPVCSSRPRGGLWWRTKCPPPPELPPGHDDNEVTFTDLSGLLPTPAGARLDL